MQFDVRYLIHEVNEVNLIDMNPYALPKQLKIKQVGKNNIYELNSLVGYNNTTRDEQLFKAKAGTFAELLFEHIHSVLEASNFVMRSPHFRIDLA